MSVHPYLSPNSTPMFWVELLKYCEAVSIVISSRCQSLRTGFLDRGGTGIGENPLPIQAVAASSGFMSVLLSAKRERRCPKARLLMDFFGSLLIARLPQFHENYRSLQSSLCLISVPMYSP